MYSSRQREILQATLAKSVVDVDDARAELKPATGLVTGQAILDVGAGHYYVPVVEAGPEAVGVCCTHCWSGVVGTCGGVFTVAVVMVFPLVLEAVFLLVHGEGLGFGRRVVGFRG